LINFIVTGQLPDALMKVRREMDTGVIEKREKQKQVRIGNSRTDVTASRIVRGLLIFAGTLFVGLGVLGIFLPLLPTTPFLLLAAACYARSSNRFYHWLLNNRWFGKYIKNYREERGIPSRVKISTISILWITIALSAYFATESFLVRAILILIAMGVTIHILAMRTLKK
jgi:uncharacterized membrane protein YbaN (DUF454 family)